MNEGVSRKALQTATNEAGKTNLPTPSIFVDYL